jgi:hypothetical protein
MTSEEEKTIEELLDEALAHAENEQARYWIRTALQRLVADRTIEDTSR